jgi:signal transduction histidine kinase
MTLLAVKPEIPQPDIGSVLDVLAHHRPIEFDCSASPVSTDPFEVDTRRDLEERLEKRYPFQPRMYPVEDKERIAVGIMLVGGPPISGEGDSMRHALQDLLANAVSYIGEWERSLRFGAEHQKYWGWVYRLLLAGDEDHILATLLDEEVE